VPRTFEVHDTLSIAFLIHFKDASYGFLLNIDLHETPEITVKYGLKKKIK
jgi:hypothetical protein